MYNTLQKPHDVHTVRRDNTSHQPYVTESIPSTTPTGRCKYFATDSHFSRKMKQEKGKRKHVEPRNLKPQLKVKKQTKKLTLTSFPGEISYSSVLDKHDRKDNRVKSYDIVLLHFNVCITYFEILKTNYLAIPDNL